MMPGSPPALKPSPRGGVAKHHSPSRTLPHNSTAMVNSLRLPASQVDASPPLVSPSDMTSSCSASVARPPVAGSLPTLMPPPAAVLQARPMQVTVERIGATLARVGKYQVHASTPRVPSFTTDPETLARMTVVAVPLKQVNDSLVARWMDEARKTAPLGHSSQFCRIVDVVESKENVFLFFSEARWSSTLMSLVTSSALTECQSRTIFVQLVRAVKACHANDIVLRDLKLPSVLVDASLERVWLSDFRYADIIPAGERISDRRGSPAYVAPEMMRPGAYCGRKADMWSLGVILYKMLSGNYPFVHIDLKELFRRIRMQEPAELPASVSDEAKDLVEMLLCKAPDQRAGIADILKHPWIAQDEDQLVPDMP